MKFFTYFIPMSSHLLKSYTFCAVLLFVFSTCQYQNSEPLASTPILSQPKMMEVPKPITDTSGLDMQTRFSPPPGYERTRLEESSFAYYLRKLPLKPHGTKVRYFDGRIKENRNVYVAVVDMEIGNKDLQQCADAVIRLRAEYLYSLKKYELIHFNLTNGFKVDYNSWRQGKRVMVNGNKTWWEQKAAPNDSYEEFRKYLDFVFMYAGTLSLSKELTPVAISAIEAGHVFIRGGSPGHAVLVVDTAINPETGEKVFMLAQSYMPAQETQILINPNNPDLSPWYPASFEGKLYTPEWAFEQTDLKGF
ncbi:MAG: DUF4846 domain-containing protein [Cytophagaceae bacterium]